MQAKKRIGLASDDAIAAILDSVLAKGNATDAVVAGVAYAAAMHPSVFLGPVTLLIVGAGVGARVIEGRVAQPGKGTQRPRGFLEGDRIPDSARVGVPGLPAALATALAASGSMTLAQAMAPALDAAKGISLERRTVLEAFSRRGPLALTDGDIARELVAAAGPLAGGVLTKDDLSTLRPAQVAAEERRHNAWRCFGIPWSNPGTRHTRAMVALDWHGTFALAAYEVHDDGVDIAELGLRAPLCAAPVLRGETRTKPGAPVDAAAPLAVREHGGLYDAAVALGAGDATADDALTAMAEAAEQPKAPPAGHALYAFRSREGVRGLTLRA